jgi:YfiR/HmsC-like
VRSSWRILGEIKTGGVLTVGETDTFASERGMINFKVQDGRVRLQVNVDAAEQANLRISSKLLNLAQIIKK